jgi:hypothetical protein
MKRVPIRAVMVFCFALCSAVVARAEFPATQPFPGVNYFHETRANLPLELFVIQIDLADPKVTVRVSPAGQQPCDGWQTALMEVAAANWCCAIPQPAN